MSDRPRRIWSLAIVVGLSVGVGFISVGVYSRALGHREDDDHAPVGELTVSRDPCVLRTDQKPGAASGQPSFWTTSVRVKPAEDGDHVVVVIPYLSESLPDDLQAVRYSWRLEPAFEAVFGVRTVSGQEVVIGGTGEIPDPQVRFWRNDYSGRPAELRKLDSQQSFERWQDSRHRLGPVLRILASSVDHADAFYRLYSTLELRNAQGGLSRLAYVEVVRFLPDAAVEARLPERMHDPTEFSPVHESERTLRDWLGFDDWYVQCIAVIRLKALGQDLSPTVLAHFFRMVALTGDRPLVRRALDSLRATEGADGAGKLLAVGCGWALPWAIRFNSPGTEAWMRLRLEWLFSNPADFDEREEIWYQKKAMLEHFLACAGMRAASVLGELAGKCTKAGDFDLLLEAISRISTREAVNLARRHPPNATFPSSEGVKWLLRSGQGEDVVLACRGLESYSGEGISREVTTPLPEAAIPVLVSKLASKGQDVRANAIRLLVAARSPVATQACLTALEDQQLAVVTATALAAAGRTDLVPQACRLALSLHQKGGVISHLWPLLLLDPPVEIHQLVFDAYMRAEWSDHRERSLGYLRRHAELSEAAALRLFHTGKPAARAAELLLDMEDACAVSFLLERLAQHPPQPRSPERVGHPRDGEKPDPEALVLEEINYLAAFVPPEQLAATARHFLAFDLDISNHFAFLDNGTGWVDRNDVADASSAMARIRNYLGAIEEHCRSRPCPSGGGPGPAPVPSPRNILRLRNFPPTAMRPLVESDDEGIRALGAALIGGTPRHSRVWPAAEVPILERMLDDRSELVQVAAFQALQNLCQGKRWYWERLLEGRPGGPARSAAMASRRGWMGTDTEWKAIHLRMLGLLAEGDSLGLAALAVESADDTEAISRALASPAMTPILAHEIVERLNRRRGDGTFAILRGALQRQLRDEIRSAIIRNLGGFVEARPLEGYGVRRASPEAGQMICEALKSDTQMIREAALGALSSVSVPESTPVLAALLGDPGRQRSLEIALALIRQPADDRLIAPLESLLRAQYGHTMINRSELAAYIAMAGDRALPFLRELELKLRNQADAFARQEYGYLMEQLVRMQDAQTVAVQADWFVSSGRKIYRSSEWPMSEALRRSIGKILASFMGKSEGESRADMAEEMCRYDHEAGILAIIGLMKNTDWHIAKRAYWNLGGLLGGSIGEEKYNDRIDFAAKAHGLERWWHLEHGRSLDRLKADALFP